jgi:hypothetical protein
MSEWQPIETAPKNGTPILLGHSEDEFCLVGEWWVEGWWSSGPFKATPLDAGELPMISIAFVPDQWMPLPDQM